MDTNHQLTVVEGKQVLEIPVDQISPDPAQPRRTFEEIEDMANSIKGAGGRILQPISLRPFEKGYRIIFGERRYKGACLVGMKTVPSIIHENVSDGEALEMQLVENLQRQDVQPMQQAIGFKRLAEEREMNVQEISVRVGKSVYFVRQQLKLNDLTSKWQAIFLKNGISLTTALKICVLPPEAQKSLYEGQVTKEDEKSSRPYISINDYLFKQYKGDLTEACFDINDAELDKKAGPCSGCPFNTALNSLFPGEEKHPRCDNVSCFGNKVNLYMERELTRVKEDPTVVFVYEGYSTPNVVEKLKGEGTEVFKMGYGEECKNITKPQKPVWETFYELRKKTGEKDKQIKEEFKKAEENYELESEAFEKRLATGKYKRAFIVYSTNDTKTGRYTFVEIIPKKTTKQTRKAINEGNATIEDIANELQRLRARQVRAKELDQEKVHKKIIDTIKDQKSIEKVPVKVTHIDSLLITFILVESLDWSSREEVKKVIKSPNLWSARDRHKFSEALKSLTKNQISYLARKIVMQKYGNNLPTSKGGFMLRLMAESLGTIPIQDYENEQNEFAKKRLANSNRAIGTLEEMKKELHQSSIKRTKKTCPAKKTEASTKSTTKNAA